MTEAKRGYKVRNDFRMSNSEIVTVMNKSNKVKKCQKTKYRGSQEINMKYTNMTKSN